MAENAPWQFLAIGIFVITLNYGMVHGQSQSHWCNKTNTVETTTYETTYQLVLDLPCSFCGAETIVENNGGGYCNCNVSTTVPVIKIEEEVTDELICCTLWGGNNCDICLKDCENGGTCDPHLDEATCICPTFYGGSNCELECDINCNHGQCVPLAIPGTFECSCHPGYNGTNCDEGTPEPETCQLAAKEFVIDDECVSNHTIAVNICSGSCASHTNIGSFDVFEQGIITINSICSCCKPTLQQTEFTLDCTGENEGTSKTYQKREAMSCSCEVCSD